MTIWQQVRSWAEGGQRGYIKKSRFPACSHICSQLMTLTFTFFSIACTICLSAFGLERQLKEILHFWRSVSAFIASNCSAVRVRPAPPGLTCLWFSFLSVERKHCFILQKTQFSNDFVDWKVTQIVQQTKRIPICGLIESIYTAAQISNSFASSLSSRPPPHPSFLVWCGQWVTCQQLLLFRQAVALRRKLVIDLTFVCTFLWCQRSGSAPLAAFLFNHLSHINARDEESR